MSSDGDTQAPGIKRRGFLTVSAAAVAGAVVGGAAVWGGTRLSTDAKPTEAPADDENAESSAPKLRRYVSTSLTIPVVDTWLKDGATPAPGYLFATPRSDVFTGGILDNTGQPVWIAPNGIDTTDLRVQQYDGKPVITYWSGRVAEGNGHGVGTILDSSYRELASVHGAAGALADLHEFALTERGTALLTTYPVVRTDLRELGGPEAGYMFGCRVQEIDVATGALLLDWDMLAHVPLSESYKKIDNDTDGADAAHPFDPFHINSVDADGDRLLISVRHTCALYALDRTNGEVLWRLGGKKSDFTVAEDAEFSWQHDARWHGADRISLFDNNGVKGDDAISAGLILSVDEEAMTVELERAFRHEKYMGYAMGNTQLLENGSVIVGWGSAPAATEFTADGEAIFGLTDVGTGSYRVYRHEWSGSPDTAPSLAVQTDKSGALEAYMSWNGATQVARWRLRAGADEASLTDAGTAEREGFETAIAIPSSVNSGVIRVQALDADGAVLGTSAIQQLPAPE